MPDSQTRASWTAQPATRRTESLQLLRHLPGAAHRPPPMHPSPRSPPWHAQTCISDKASPRSPPGRPHRCCQRRRTSCSSLHVRPDQTCDCDIACSLRSGLTKLCTSCSHGQSRNRFEILQDDDRLHHWSCDSCGSRWPGFVRPWHPEGDLRQTVQS